ncbi:MAG: DUF4136 domain-containing protein [Bacteroidales bacterium]|nr:DUF4136 domain-containing protein [Bacteroidales bacterium]
MKKIFILFLIGSLLILSGCGPSVRVFSDIDDSGRFEQYATYSFLDFTDGNKKTITGMELERIRVAFARELEQRGLKFVEENGDVSVQITVYHREARDHYYYPPGSYSHMKRAIVVDLYDNQTRKHVWHCAAVGELVYDPSERAVRLSEVAAEIFEKYPAEKSEEI